MQQLAKQLESSNPDCRTQLAPGIELLLLLLPLPRLNLPSEETIEWAE